MRRLLLITLILITLVSGCTIKGDQHSIKLDTDVVPSKVSLDAPVAINLEANVKNIGTSTETITADVVKTEGLVVANPPKTVFTLKPGESRTITFTANLLQDAVPGDYIIDIQVKTNSGDMVWDRAKLRVVSKKGWF